MRGSLVDYVLLRPYGYQKLPPLQNMSMPIAQILLSVPKFIEIGYRATHADRAHVARADAYTSLL